MLRDRMGRMTVLRRLARLEQGNFGDCRSVGETVLELRIQHGPGYRIYFTLRASEIVLLLCAGDKDSQSRDITLAKRLKRELGNAE
ncbi:type II toxin-antitoxin system RelE/ParE family toxin [Gellertiella hungarica]|uniref:type II toxin-antitoxin system RelE/ParE family toxin n=1 Tax=Gellertiella hungarica TaxID=1572859 RepID=UPI002484439B|nr:type II toxin-antitoxin system RelE/ParE family toxin [Gellertiella hungarica]